MYGKILVRKDFHADAEDRIIAWEVTGGSGQYVKNWLQGREETAEETAELYYSIVVHPHEHILRLHFLDLDLEGRTSSVGQCGLVDAGWEAWGPHGESPCARQR